MNKDLIEVDGETSLETADPLIREAKAELEKRKGAGNNLFEVSWKQRGNEYAWSNLPNMVIELEAHLRCMLGSGYGPKYVRDFLISSGYGHRQITEVFKRVTGVSFEDYMDVQGVLQDTPATIPGINYGWGEAKSGKYDFYFVMPWNMGYAVFGQKGDLIREEADYEYTLQSAREWLDKNVKDEAHYWDKPVDKSMLEGEYPKQQISEPKHTFLTANEKFHLLDDWIYENRETLPKHEVKSHLIQSYKGGDIDAHEFLELWNDYDFKKSAAPISTPPVQNGETNRPQLREQVFDLSDQELNKPLDNDFNEVTPSDFFENQIEKTHFDMNPSASVDKVLKYLKEKNDSLKDFEVYVSDFKYDSVEMNEQLQKQDIQVGDEEKDFFSANAIIPVIVQITDKTLASPGNQKMGRIVFNVVDTEILSSDLIKGDDGHLYGLTESGLTQYFAKERTAKEETEAGAY